MDNRSEREARAAGMTLEEAMLRRVLRLTKAVKALGAAQGFPQAQVDVDGILEGKHDDPEWG